MNKILLDQLNLLLTELQTLSLPVQANKLTDIIQQHKDIPTGESHKPFIVKSDKYGDIAKIYDTTIPTCNLCKYANSQPNNQPCADCNKQSTHLHYYIK